MQILDILSPHVAPGAVVLDLTSERADLSSHTHLPPQLGLVYRHGRGGGDDAGGARPAVGVVLQHVATAAVEGMADATVDLDVADLAARVVHVVFFDRPEAIVERGVLEQAARGGWELAGVHATGHPVFRHAAVLVPADPADAGTLRGRLRVVNEYRFERFRAGQHEPELRAATARIDKLSRRVHELEKQLAARAAELARLRAARDELAARAAAVEARLAEALRRLARARSALSFRLGRATRVALRDAARDPLGVPRRWLATFRGPDERLDDLTR